MINGQRRPPGTRELVVHWRVLLAATAGCGLGASALPAASFGTFIIPLSQEFGWSRGEVSAGLLFMTGALAISSPIFGTLLDRFGVRSVATFCIPMLAASFVGLALSNGSLSLFYLCFALTALLGGGTAPISYSRAINQSFTCSRGMALGIMFSGMGLAAAILPIMSTHVTSVAGWRWSFVILGGLALAALPFVRFGIPKHAPPASPRLSRQPTSHTYDFLRTRSFWTIASGCSLASFASYGLLVHFVPLLIDEGLTVTRAAYYAALVGIASIAGRLVIGVLIDRLFAPAVGAIVLVTSAAGCITFFVLGLPVAPLIAVLIGFSFGTEVDLVSFLVARYFGITQYGLIYGIIYSCFAIGAALGPAIGGFVFDATGSYSNALVGAALLLICSAMLLISLPAYPSDLETIID